MVCAVPFGVGSLQENYIKRLHRLCCVTHSECVISNPHNSAAKYNWGKTKSGGRCQS